jgi:magnesium-transporting ATPase (P-type)
MIDVIREEAPEFIQVLLNLQIEAFMLTGDQRETACYVNIY